MMSGAMHRKSRPEAALVISRLTMGSGGHLLLLRVNMDDGFVDADGLIFGAEQHLLSAIARVPFVGTLELFRNTDRIKSRAAMPIQAAHFVALNWSIKDIRMCEDTSADRDTASAGRNRNAVFLRFGDSYLMSNGGNRKNARKRGQGSPPDMVEARR